MQSMARIIASTTASASGTKSDFAAAAITATGTSTEVLQTPLEMKP